MPNVHHPLLFGLSRTPSCSRMFCAVAKALSASARILHVTTLASTSHVSRQPLACSSRAMSLHLGINSKIENTISAATLHAQRATARVLNHWRRDGAAATNWATSMSA